MAHMSDYVRPGKGAPETWAHTRLLVISLLDMPLESKQRSHLVRQCREDQNIGAAIGMHIKNETPHTTSEGGKTTKESVRAREVDYG